MKLWGFLRALSRDESLSRSSLELPSPGSTPLAPKRQPRTSRFVLAASLLIASGLAFHTWHNTSSPNSRAALPLAASNHTPGPFDSLLHHLASKSNLLHLTSQSPAPSAPIKMSRSSLSLPLFFEANRGQSDSRVQFLARGSGYTLFLTPTETVFAEGKTSLAASAFPSQSSKAWKDVHPAILRMKLLNANPAPMVTGAMQLPGKVNYLIGKDPRNWHIGVPLYSEVHSAQVYPGIDLVFHGDQRQLEYDFLVSPGADPGRIRFNVTGADKLQVADNGDLVLRTAKTEFRMHKPVIYQQIGALRRPVDGGFALQHGNLVAFNVSSYDKTLPLVIDPPISFASFLGGGGEDLEGGIDLDTTNPSAPRLYVAGTTTDTTTFTETKTVLGAAPGAGTYSFVAKVDPTTTGAASLNYLTFIGGSVVFTGGTSPCENVTNNMRLDLSGGAGEVEPVLLGNTNCQDFPVTFGGPVGTSDDLFLTRLAASGAALDNSTLLGGNGSAGLGFGGGASLFLNPEGSIVLTGSTTSTNLPITSNAYSVSFNNGTPGGFDDCFIGEFDRSFNVLYMTYLNVGGSSTSSNTAGCGLGGLDAAGKIYGGGNTFSATAFNLANGGTGANGFQKNFVGTAGTTSNAFLFVLDPSKTGVNQLVFSTYIAGGGGTAAQAGAIDAVHGLAVIGGFTVANSTTNAPDIPILNAFQATNPTTGSGTGFITLMDTTKTGASSLLASTYFGGSTAVGNSSVHALAFDPQTGNPPTLRIIAGGQTSATAFPTANSLQSSLVGTQNAFISVFTAPNSGSTFNMALLFSTYLGGGAAVAGQTDSVRALVTDANHNVYALGRTASSNFFANTSPATTVNGFQATCASCNTLSDLVIFVLAPQSGAPVPDLTVAKSHSGNFAQGQTGAQYSITVTNTGNGPTIGTVNLADTLPTGLTATAISGTGWSCSLSPLSCTRSDALPAGTSYPVITLTVTVSTQAPPSVTNIAVVSGGSETNTSNNTASDSTTITGTVVGCTDTYSGLTGGSWGLATNWSKGAIPGAADVACIPSGITVIFSSSAQSISGLNSSGTLNLTTGSLAVANNSSANALNITGGTLAVNSQFTVSGPVTLTSGAFGGTGEIDLGGLLTWSGGFICSAISGVSCTTGTSAVMNANAGISFTPAPGAVLSNRTLNITGATSWTGTAGTLTIENGAIVNNNAGSTWSYSNDSTLAYGGGTGTSAFNNLGTFQKIAGTATTTIQVPFHNTGTVNANSGTMTFTGGGNCTSTCPGTYSVGTSGTLNFSSNVFAQSGPINGLGIVNFNGATMNFGSGNVTISTKTVNLTAGALAGAAPGVLNFSTPLNWSGGFICSANSSTSCVLGTNATLNLDAGINFPSSASPVLSNRTVNLSGTALWSGSAGNLTIENGAVFNVPSGSVWNFTNDSNLSNGGGTGTNAFNNGGTFEKTTGSATSTVTVPFHNTGTVLGNSGILTFSGGGNCGSSCPGTYTPAAGASINFSAGIFSQGGPINGAGTVNFNGATLNFGTGTTTISTNTVNLTNGAIAGSSPGVLNFSTPLTWTGGFMCSSLSGASCLTGATATTNANAGINFVAPSGSPNVVLSNRIINLKGTAAWSGTAGSMTIENGAVFNALTGSVWNFANDSNLSNGGGTGTNAFNNTGTFEKTGGTATSTVSVPFHNTGSVLGNSATLAFSGGGNCGSSCSGAYTSATGGTISFTAGIFAQNGAINGAGTVNFSGGTMDFGTGTTTISTTKVNLTSGTLAGAAPGVLNFSSPLTWTGGFICSSLSGVSCIVATNSTVNANAGINFIAPSGAPNTVLSNRTLNLPGTATWSGTSGGMTIENGAIINISSTGIWNFGNDSFLNNGGGTGTVAVNNAGNFEKTAGTANTTITAPFHNTGSVNGNSGTMTFSGGGNCGSTCAGTYSAGTGGTINFSANTFAQSGPISGAGTVGFTGATMDFGAGTVNISTSAVNFTSGIFAGAAPGVVNITNNMVWTGGTMCSALTGASCAAGTNATTNANGGITFSANAQLDLLGRNLTTAGTSAWTSTNPGDLLLQNGSSITNSGTWDFQNDSYVYLYTGASNTFNNSGTLQKSGGTNTTTGGIYGNDGTFNNTGQVLSKVGQLNINGGGTGNGSWAANSGAILAFGSAGGTGTFAMNGPFTGAGTMVFAGDTENITGTYNVTGGTTASNGLANFLSPATVTSIGALSISGGTANFSTGKPIAGTTLALSGGSLSGTDTVTISGASTWSGGSMCTTTSSGSCAAPTGSQGTTVATGGITFSSNAQLTINGRVLNTAGSTAWTATNPGDLLMQNGSTINNSGTWDFQNDSYVYLYTGASNTFNNTGTLQKSGGTATTTTGFYGSDGTFNNTGQVLAKAGQLNINGGGTGNGSWAANSGAILAFGSVGSGGTFAMNGPFTGAGTMVFAGDTENITGTYNVTGGTTASGSGVANFLSPATVTSTGPLTISGGALAFSTGNPIIGTTLALSGGSLAGSDTLTLSGLTTWTGGNMCTSLSAGTCVAPTGSQGTTVATGGIAFSSNAQLTLNGRTLNTSGTNAWTATNPGDLLLLNGSTINNSGTWDLQNDSYVYLYTGASNTFNNTGTFQKSGGTTTTTTSGVYGSDGAFKNSGLVIAKSGALNFLGNFSQTGGTTSLAGGTIGTTTNPLSIQGGTVIGNGMITGGIANSAGTVAPGTTTPAITIGNIALGTTTLGTYAQGVSGGFTVKIGGTAAGQFDTLTATGAVTLAGTLNGSLVNGFTPVLGNTFTIITASSVSGTFASNNLPAISAGLGWKVTYSPTTVVLSVVSVSTPVASLNPSTLAFPNTLVSATSAVQKVQLQNTGSSPMTITSIQPTGTDAANYMYTADAAQPCPISPTKLGNGATCFLDVAFAPLSSGAHNAAQITVTDDSGGTPGATQTVSLTGTGIVLSSISVTPATANLPMGGTQVYTATGTYSDASTQNLTSTATWASSNSAVATISNTAGTQGQAKGLTGGSTFITATQGGITSNQASLTVTTANHFVISSPGSAVAGNPFSLTVFAEDSLGNIVTGYTGTVHFTSTDGQAVLPANATLTNGSGTFSVTLKTLGTQTVTATDTVTSSITGTSSSITVSSGTATHFLVTAPATATPGTAFNFTVSARDSSNNVATAYSGTVHFTSTDGQAVLPANSVLTSGTGTFSATLKTGGTQTITATDTATSSITGTSGAIAVNVTLISIAVTPVSPSIAKGNTQQFTATGTYSDTTTANITSQVTWNSATTTVATINATGLATGVGTGTSNITASLTGVTSPADVLTVTAAALKSIAITPVSPSIAKGTTQQFTATGTYTDTTTANITSQVTWISGTTTVATINAAGLATGVGTGTSNITASLTGITSPADVLTVTAATLQSIAITPVNPSISKGSTQQFTATGTYSDTSTANITTQVTWSSATTTVATIAASGLASGVGTGTSNITASLTGVTSPPDVLTVTGATLQSIAITPVSPAIAKGTTQQFTATGTYSDTTTANVTSQVTWTSGTTTVATISSTGLATGVGTGTSNITASLTGVTSPADVLTVTAATLKSIAITPVSPSISKGNPQQFTATGTYSDSSTANVTSQVTWSSATTTVATINAAGLATGVGTGTSNITASLTGVTSPADVLTVTAATLQSIAITPVSPSIAKGTTQQFTATGTYSDTTTANITSQVTWSSGTTTVATITTAGLATGVGTGTSNITASLTGVTSPADVLTVTAATLKSIAITPVSPSISKGNTQQFTATGTYSDTTTANITSQVTWNSATTTVATISAAGLATGVGTGTSNITASLTGVTSPADVLTVTAATLQSIAITPVSPSIAKGATQQLTATGTYSDTSTANITTQVTWNSATSTVATISATGLATGVGTGTSNITASLTGVTSPADVLTVTAATLKSIAITPVSPSISKGNTQQFTATGTYSDTTTANITSQVMWNSATTTVATISAAGLATGVGTGTSNITASLTGVTSPADVLTVTAATLQSIAITPVSPSISKGGTQQFTATGTYSDTTTANITSQVTWNSATTTVATISAAGLATGVGTGTSSITASLTGVTSPADVLTVTAATLQSIAITPASPSIAKGTTQQFVATGTYSDTSTANITSQVTWNSGTPTVATITTAGLATGVGTGTSNITASLTGVTSPADVLTVTAATLKSIAITPVSPSISKGNTQQFTATGTYSDTTTANITSQVTWISGTTTVATISAAGLATGVGAGTSNITASLTGVTSPADVLTVTGATLQSIAITPVSPSIAKGTTQQFTATGTYSDTTTANITSQVTWISGTTTVATINAAGLATGVGTGTSNITASLTGVTSPADVLTVTAPTLKSIAITPVSPSISKGATQQFTATGTYSDTTTANITSQVTWISGTTTVATITTAGLATGVVTGTSNITASLTGVTSPADVLTVTAATLQSIAITPVNPSISKGNTQQFTATGTYSDTTTANITSQVTWSSGTTTVATISSTGLATGLGTGTSNVTASLTGVTSPVDVLTVTAATLKSIAITPVSPSISKGNTQQFTATGTYSDTTTANITSQVTWISGTTTVATISAAGLATGVGAGTSNITASLTGVTSPADVLTVTGATLQSIAITPVSPSIAKGTTQQFTATGTYSDTTTANITSQVTWISATTTVASINAAGLATGVGTGTSNITASLTGVTSPVDQLTVTAATLVSIAVTPASPSVTAGLTQTFTATGTFSDGTIGAVPVNWLSSNTNIATINSSGVATGVLAGGPVTITATSTANSKIFGTASLTITPQTAMFPLTVTSIGTGSGKITDLSGAINCTITAGATSGACSANYPPGTQVTLAATPTQPSTFGGWLNNAACSGTGGCIIAMGSAQSVTASFAPAPQMIPVPFTPGMNASGMAAYDCPSNPNPSPTNPCLDPNAHAVALNIGQVITPFTLTVVATEVPPTIGNGICPNGLTVKQDFDCRFTSFFTFQTNPNGDRIVPICYPYANGNCVYYSVYYQTPGTEPDPSWYAGPINWNIAFNDDKFTPPAPWAGGTPRFYEDPDQFVSGNSPYGTNCNNPMQMGNPGTPTNPPIYCQFVYDITTSYDPNKKVDAGIGGRTRVFSDFVVAIPPVFAPVVTITTTPDAPTVTAGNPIGLTIAVSNSAAATANNVSLSSALPAGTNVNWSITPAYPGPGTCGISGAIGSQVLSCSFGTLSPSTNLSVHVQSASSSVGTALSSTTLSVGTQQTLSIGSIAVQPVTASFTGLTPSQSIPAGTTSITLGGVLGSGSQFPASGETVSITINGVKQTTTLGANGVFTLQFPTAAFPASATPYTITYSYAGDSTFSAATDSSTTLTVVSGGVPRIAVTALDTGTTNSNFFVDVQLTNNGTGVAENLTLSSLAFRTLLGTGTIALNTTLSPALPANLGTLNVGASQTIRLYLSGPTTVTRFVITEYGGVNDAAGNPYTYSSSQSVAY